MAFFAKNVTLFGMTIVLPKQGAIMSAAKIAISMDRDLLKRLDALVDQAEFSSRSQAIEVAVEAIVVRLTHYRLAKECEKLDPAFEQAMADEGLAEDAK